MYFDEILGPIDDRGRIIRSLKSMDRFLTTLALSPQEILPDLRYRASELERSVQLAWYEDILQSMARLIDAAPRLSQERLQGRGLTGASLEAKLTIIKWWDSQLQDLGKKALVYLLKCINSFLGSLPLGVAEPVKEAKEMLENTLDLDE